MEGSGLWIYNNWLLVRLDDLIQPKLWDILEQQSRHNVDIFPLFWGLLAGAKEINLPILDLLSNPKALVFMHPKKHIRVLVSWIQGE